MSLLDDLDPVLIPWAQKLYDLAQEAGTKPRVTSTRRSYAKQESLYKAFLAGHSKYPVAPPGTSAHEYGLAFDMVVDNEVDQADCGTVWRRWGGVYKASDPVHFEYPGFSPTGGTSPSAGETPILESIQRKAERLADLIVSVVPSPLRGILSTAQLASRIASTYGVSGAAELDYLLNHPAEVTTAVAQAAARAFASYF